MKLGCVDGFKLFASSLVCNAMGSETSPKRALPSVLFTIMLRQNPIVCGTVPRTIKFSKTCNKFMLHAQTKALNNKRTVPFVRLIGLLLLAKNFSRSTRLQIAFPVQQLNGLFVTEKWFSFVRLEASIKLWNLCINVWLLKPFKRAEEERSDRS